MVDLPVLGHFEVVENGSRGGQAAREVVHAEALEGRRAELAAELLAVDLLGEKPLIELVGIVGPAEGELETVLAAALVDHLLGLEVRKELVHIGIGPLGGVKFTRRDVEKGDARRLAAEADGGQKGVLLVREDVVLQDDARGDELRDAAFDEPLD